MIKGSRRSDIDGNDFTTVEEFIRLYGAYAAATAEAFANLQKYGVSSEKFHEADDRATKLWGQLCEIEDIELRLGAREQKPSEKFD